MQIARKIKGRATIDSGNFTSQYLSDRNEITIWKRYVYICVYCTIIYNG